MADKVFQIFTFCCIRPPKVTPSFSDSADGECVDSLDSDDLLRLQSDGLEFARGSSKSSRESNDSVPVPEISNLEIGPRVSDGLVVDIVSHNRFKEKDAFSGNNDHFYFSLPDCLHELTSILSQPLVHLCCDYKVGSLLSAELERLFKVGYGFAKSKSLGDCLTKFYSFIHPRTDDFKKRFETDILTARLNYIRTVRNNLSQKVIN